MVELFAYIGCFFLVCLSLFQIALILGAPIGKYAWGGGHTILPPKLRMASLGSIVLYGFFASVLLTKTGVVYVIPSESFVNGAVWVMAAYFLVGVLMNAVSRSAAERRVMTPVAGILAITFLYAAMS